MSAPEFRPFVDRAPEYDIRDGVMCVDYGNWSLHMPLRIARLAHSRIGKVLREHDAAGQVVPFKGRR